MSNFARIFFGGIGMGLLALCGWAQPVRAGVELSPAEREWIKAHPVIRVGVDPNFPPSSFYDEKGRLSGFDADYLARIGQLTGLRFEIARSESWLEAYAAAERHEIDLLTSISVTAKRLESFRFTAIYTNFPVAIITRMDGDFFSTLTALEGRRIAVPLGFSVGDRLREMGVHAELVETPTITAAFLAVSSGQCYATTANLANASYLIRQLGISNLKISGIVPQGAESRFAVRKDWPELVGIMDKALAAIPEIDRQAMINPWVQLAIPRVINWSLVWKGALAALGAGGAVLWYVLRRSRRLTRQLEERKRYQQEIEEARDRLAALNDEKTNLLNMVAHDLRGPLTGFALGVGLVELELGAQGSADLKATLTAMQRQIQAMRRLVDSLLDMQALESGSRLFAQERVDAAAIVGEVAGAYRTEAAAKNIRLDWLPPAEGVTGLGDQAAFRQVTENLVSNALKYSPPGGRVQLTLQVVGPEVRLDVRDSGPGISPEEQPRLFGKFSRLSARPTGGESSHGLGLYIVRHLMTAMQGRVWCESRPGQGATFALAIPRA